MIHPLLYNRAAITYAWHGARSSKGLPVRLHLPLPTTGLVLLFSLTPHPSAPSHIALPPYLRVFTPSHHRHRVIPKAGALPATTFTARTQRRRYTGRRYGRGDARWRCRMRSSMALRIPAAPYCLGTIRLPATRTCHRNAPWRRHTLPATCYRSRAFSLPCWFAPIPQYPLPPVPAPHRRGSGWRLDVVRCVPSRWRIAGNIPTHTGLPDVVVSTTLL